MDHRRLPQQCYKAEIYLELALVFAAANPAIAGPPKKFGDLDIPAAARTPSFDCKASAGNAEGADAEICNIRTLALLDQEMARLYKAMVASSPTTETEKAVREQRAWLADRNAACTTSGPEVCAESYVERIEDLKESIETGVSSIPIANANDPAQLLCRGIQRCRVTASERLGHDHEGNELSLAEIVLAGAPEDAAQPIGPYPEKWLIAARSGRIIRRQKLAVLIPGWHPSDYFANSLEVSSGSIEIGKTWGRGETESLVVGLDPVRPLKQFCYEHHPAADSRQASWTWDWDSFTGSGTATESVYGGGGPFLVIPRLPISANFWDKVPLGDCSLQLSGQNGFVLAGTLDHPADVALRVVLVKDRVLIANVYGKSWSQSARNWLHDDHLEIWDGEFFDDGNGSIDCGKSVRQWGVRLADGKVFRGYGTCKNRLQVSMADLRDARGGFVRAFRIVLPPLCGQETDEKDENLAISFSRGDGRSAVKWLLSTSRVKYGIPHTFSVVEDIPSKYAACAAEDGFLTVQRRTAFKDDEPLFKR